MRMRIAAVTMETGLLIFCACVHVTLLFFVGGLRAWFIHELSGLSLEPRCPDNRGSTVLYYDYNTIGVHNTRVEK